MNLEAVVITELSAEKSEFPRFLKLIISRLLEALASRETEMFSCNFYISKKDDKGQDKEG